MKGMVEQMFYIVIIVLALFMLFIFFTYQRGTRGAEVRKTVEERGLSEELNGVGSSLFNNKLPVAEKSYLASAIDAILEGTHRDKELDKAFYGVGIGTVNATEIINPFLDSYAEGRLELRIETPDGAYVYGKIKPGNVIYSYESLIPVPEERVGKITILLSS